MSERPDQTTKANKPVGDARDTYGALSIGAWVAVAILAINVSHFVGEEVGGIVFESEGALLAIFNGFWIGILKASPTICIAAALIDFAFFFHRCGEGDVYSSRNVKTLRTGADSLIAAAIMSAVVVPFLLDILGEPDPGRIFRFSDLALGVGLMGAALHGFALVLKDAVALKEDNDQFV